MLLDSKPSSISLRWRLRRFTIPFVLCALLALLSFQKSLPFTPQTCLPPKINGTTPSSIIAQYFTAYPVIPSELGELGQRIQFLTTWISEHTMPYPPLLEAALATAFPFIRRNPPFSPNDPAPFTSLLESFDTNRGIVITARSKTFRSTAHIISNIRSVLNTTLPIQVAYFEDADFPVKYRNALLEMDKGIEFLNLQHRLNDQSMQLTHAEETMKPFAVLGSRFKEVMFVDGNTIFLQKPEYLLDSSKGYKETGVLLFQDNGFRMLREGWWLHQLRNHRMSGELQRGMELVMPKEGKSSVIIVDKRKIGILMGLLHVCWQHTKPVRKESMERTRGGRDSWWLGMELSGVNYTFAEHFGVAAGKDDTVFWVDDRKKLLWLDGTALMKEQGRLVVAEKLMLVDVGISKDKTPKWIEVSKKEREIIEASLRAAKGVDGRFENLISRGERTPSDNHKPRKDADKSQKGTNININIKEDKGNKGKSR